mgnify:CR=1 FL=1
MNINISNTSTTPLYEQIKNQIQNQILDSTLKQGEGLPSIRNFAKELKVSIITIKRAYEELEKEGFLVIAGKVPRRYFEKRWYGFSVWEVVE